MKQVMVVLLVISTTNLAIAGKRRLNKQKKFNRKREAISCSKISNTPMTEDGDRQILSAIDGKKNGESSLSSTRHPGGTSFFVHDRDPSLGHLPEKIILSKNSTSHIGKSHIPEGGLQNISLVKNSLSALSQSGVLPKYKHKLREKLDQLLDPNSSDSLSKAIHPNRDRTLFRSKGDFEKAWEEVLTKGKSEIISEAKDEQYTGIRVFRLTVGQGKKKSSYRMVICERANCGDSGTIRLGEVQSFYPECGPGILKVPSAKTINFLRRNPKKLNEIFSTNHLCKD